MNSWIDRVMCEYMLVHTICRHFYSIEIMKYKISTLGIQLHLVLTRDPEI
jgi:hypothetical protein